MKFITVLNTYNGTVWMFEYPTEELLEIINKENDLDESEAIEIWLVSKDFNLSNIDWMVHSDSNIYSLKDL